jgi:hypothetical protein
VALQFHDVELRMAPESANLNQTVTFGPTTNPVLTAVPQATANVLNSVLVVQMLLTLPTWS